MPREKSCRASGPCEIDSGLSLVADHGRYLAGDALAGERVIRALYDPVRAQVRRRLRRYPADVVADAVQEAMVRVVAYLPQCRATSDRQLVRWALLVGWHAALRYVRSPAAGVAIGWNGISLEVACSHLADRTRPMDVVEWTLVAGGDATASDESYAGAWSEQITGSDDESEAAFARTLLRVLLVEAAALEDRDLIVLVWERATLDRSFEDLAAARGITPGAAKRRYQRTVARLRRVVAAYADVFPEPFRSAALQLATTLPSGTPRTPGRAA